MTVRVDGLVVAYRRARALDGVTLRLGPGIADGHRSARNNDLALATIRYALPDRIGNGNLVPTQRVSQGNGNCIVVTQRSKRFSHARADRCFCGAIMVENATGATQGINAVDQSPGKGVATQNNVVGYTMTKGALNAMARALAVDEAAYGVRVNALLPGSIDTPMLRASAHQWSDGTAEGSNKVIADWGLMHPLGRVGQPREVGSVCSFLASDEASFVTGAEIRVDGGLLSRIAAVLPSKD